MRRAGAIAGVAALLSLLAISPAVAAVLGAAWPLPVSSDRSAPAPPSATAALVPYSADPAMTPTPGATITPAVTSTPTPLIGRPILGAGWHLIAPVDRPGLYGITAEALAERLAADGIAVSQIVRWDAATGRWSAHLVGRTANDFPIELAEGYFIRVTNQGGIWQIPTPAPPWATSPAPTASPTAMAASTPTTGPTALATPTPTSTDTSTPATAATPSGTSTSTPIPTPANTPTTGPDPTPTGLALCTVARVVDGDTFDVSDCADAGRIRLILVDSPEVYGGAECYGREASEYTGTRLTVGELIGLERDVSDADHYGRLLRYIWADGELYNWRMVYDGYAALAVYPPDVKHQDLIAAAQAAAQAAQRGLWPVCGGVDTPATPTPTGLATPTPSSPTTPTATPTTIWVGCGGATATITALDKTAEVVTLGGSGDLTGWYLVSESGGQRYDFPAGFVLSGAVQVRSAVSPFPNTSSALWWTGDYVWNNSADDDALLYDCTGTLVSVFEDGVQ